MNFSGYGGPFEMLISFLEEKFTECVKEVQDVEILIPNGLSRSEYEAALVRGGDTDY